MGGPGPLVPADAEIVTGPAQVEAESKGTDEQLAMIRKSLLAFGGIALFVGAFVIFNILSITIAQRTRELATLRTLGRPAARCSASVSARIGPSSASWGRVAGLFLGIGLDKALAALFAAADGTHLPDGGAVLDHVHRRGQPSVGVELTLPPGSARPAGPLAARRSRPCARARRFRRRRWHRYTLRDRATAIALGSGVISVGLFAGGLTATQSSLLLALGCIAPSWAWRAISPALVTPLPAVVGLARPAPAGTAGRLARRTPSATPPYRRSPPPRRWSSWRSSPSSPSSGRACATPLRDGVDRAVRADYVVTATTARARSPPTSAGRSPGGAGAAEGEQRSPGLGQRVLSRHVGQRARRRDDRRARATPTGTPGAETSLANLDADGAIVQHDFAAAHDLRVGSHFEHQDRSRQARRT